MKYRVFKVLIYLFKHISVFSRAAPDTMFTVQEGETVGLLSQPKQSIDLLFSFDLHSYDEEVKAIFEFPYTISVLSILKRFKLIFHIIKTSAHSTADSNVETITRIYSHWWTLAVPYLGGKIPIKHLLNSSLSSSWIYLT